MRILYFTLFLMLILPLIGLIYQLAATKIDETKFPPPGTLIDIGGYRLHLNCMGDGQQSIIFEAGHGGNSLEWSLIQPELAKHARVYTYDRAGYGWSEESPHPRTSLQIVRELHTLLSKAQAPKPYILVGHSVGGIFVRLYAHLYPDEVSGIVLVDSSHEDQMTRCTPEPKVSFFTRYPKISIALTYIGIHRLLMNIPTVQSQLLLNFFPELAKKQYIAKLSTNCAIRTALKETASFEVSLKQLKEVNFSFNSKPLTILTAGMAGSTEAYNQPQKWLDETHKIWLTLQNELTVQSKQAKQIIIENSDHMIPRREPKCIINSVLEMMKTLNPEIISTK